MTAGRQTRHLDWDGCFNVRDLGGLRTTDGRTTRPGRIVRADSLDDLTANGWRQLEDHGIRTIVDLRNDDERDAAAIAEGRPPSVTTIHLPLDAIDETDFWKDWYDGPQFATPLYYRPHIERFPERTQEAVHTIATAPPGGVVFHCAGGRDRAGQIAMIVLGLAGVRPDEIARDYELSRERLPARFRAKNQDDDGPILDAFLEERRTSAGALILRTLEELDDIGKRIGLADADAQKLRARLLDP